MIEQNSDCSDDRLRSLLQSDDDVGDNDNQLAAKHIATCQRCQSRLEQLAAEPDEWSEARESLLSGRENDTGRRAAMNGRPWARRRWQQRTTAWTDSMSRQLLSPPSHPEMLGRIGRYEVERLIGAGGMGVVFKAFDTELNRPVAVKVLAPILAGSGAARQRFAREARAAAAVVHEHVVSIHNVETDGESPFLVMQYVAGESLQGRIDREGPLDVCEILRIGMQTAAGLAAAHAQGLVHRDVKPSNILLEKGVERALLTDFGLARASDDASLTHTGYHPGTPQYMSPEQARGDGVDSRSDLFSLGSVIYTMCTGRPPFRAETSYGILRRITDTEPRSIREINPNIPDWLESIIAKLHAKSPEDRFTSADEVHELLEQCLAHVQQPTTVPLPQSCVALRDSREANQPLGASPRFPRKPHANAVRLIMGAAFLFLLIFAGILIVLELNKGKLTIESEADEVTIRVMQGDKVVERLTVTRTGASVRIAAGQYVVEIDDEIDGISVKDGDVALKRGGRVLVKLVRHEEVTAAEEAIWASQKVADGTNVLPNSVGMRFVQIPAGEFSMGRSQPYGEILRLTTIHAGVDRAIKTEVPQHRVRIAPFLMQTTEVTQQQWKDVMGTRPWNNKDSFVKEGPEYPATYITWDDAQEFCLRLSKTEGKTYRLPTEAEWEYACRAQTSTLYSFGDSPAEMPDYGWITDNAYSSLEKFAHRVARQKPNAWGLYDMHGNVWEWCGDWLGEDYYEHSAEADPRGPSDGTKRIIRGGSWRSADTHARSTFRFGLSPADAENDLGFRVVAVPSRELEIDIEEENVPGTVDSPAKTMPVEIVLPHPFRLHWPGAMERPPTTARFAVPVSEPSHIRVNEIVGHHGLEIAVTIEPTDHASSEEFAKSIEAIRIGFTEDDLTALKATKPWDFPYEFTYDEENGTAIAIIKITAQQRPVTPIADIMELDGTWRLVDAHLVSDQALGLPFLDSEIYKSAWIAIDGPEWRYVRNGNELIRTLEASYDLTASPQKVDLKSSSREFEKHEHRLFELHSATLITARRISGTHDFPASFDEPMALIEQYQRVGVVTDRSDVNEHTVSISLGTADGIRLNQRLQITDGSSVLGTVEAYEIGKHESYARVVEWSADRPIRKGDRLIPVGATDASQALDAGFPSDAVLQEMHDLLSEETRLKLDLRYVQQFLEGGKLFAKSDASKISENARRKESIESRQQEITNRLKVIHESELGDLRKVAENAGLECAEEPLYGQSSYGIIVYANTLDRIQKDELLLFHAGSLYRTCGTIRPLRTTGNGFFLRPNVAIPFDRNIALSCIQDAEEERENVKNGFMPDSNRARNPSRAYRANVYDRQSGKLIQANETSEAGANEQLGSLSLEPTQSTASQDEGTIPGAVDPFPTGYPYYTPQGPRDYRAANPPSDAQSKAPRTAIHVIADGDELNDLPDVTTDWESTNQELESYRIDLVPFESRSQQLWDNSPTINKE